MSALTSQHLAFVNLIALGESYLLNLHNVGDEWTLILTDRKAPHRQHTYVSTNLIRLINHAWAGAPEGRI